MSRLEDHPLYRPLPRSLSHRRLFLPDRTYPFLRDAADHPFLPGARRFERVNAWWLAEIAMLAYVRQTAFIEEKLNAAGFTAAEVLQAAPGDRFNTRCIWAEHRDFAVACFRGTEPGNLKDYLTDARFLPAEVGAGARVHRGFREAFGAEGIEPGLADRIEAARGAGRTIWLTGHSLGAALATLAAHRLGPVQGLYALGSPRVGNEAFWGGIAVPAYRIVNHADLVTMIPSALPGHYVHGGELKYIDRRGRLHEDIPLRAVLRDRWNWPGAHYAEVAGRWWNGEFNQIPLRSISDHSPLHYALHLWNNYAAGVVTS
jgi:triacylglycerol lipase